MTPYERHRAVLNNEQHDRIDVTAAIGLRNGPMGGWERRLTKRGMGVTHIIPPYRPMFFFDTIVNPFLKDVTYIQKTYFENGIWKTAHMFETNTGQISSIVGKNPGLDLTTGHVYEPFIKKKEDWKVVNLLFEKMYEALSPNYR